VGPVDRLVQRRQIRRATEQALLTPILDRHIEVDDDEPITGPILVDDVHDELGDASSDAPDDFAPDDRLEIGPGRQTFAGPVGAPIADTLTFGSTPRPWHRTKRPMIAVIAVAAAAMVAWLVVVALRSPGTASEIPKPTVTSPAPAPTTAQLSPTTAPPPQPIPPPPLPPPPPPPAQEAPVITGSNPPARSEPPSQTDKPQIGVTRTPISVAPPSVKPAPGGSNSATPGDAPIRRGWGFF
jgi:hypothetical protein